MGFVYAGAFALAAAEVVADAVFGFEYGKFEAFDARAFGFGLDFDGLGGGEPVFPAGVVGKAI